MGKLFRVVDFETTGLAYNAGILEIGYTDLVWEGRDLTIKDPIAQYCDPGIPCEIGALAVHHITPDKYEGKPHPSAILPSLEEGVDFFVAHNAKFDKQFYHPAKSWICTMRVAQQIYPQAPAYKNQVLRYFLGLELDEALAMPPHGAGPDSYVTAHILKRMMIDIAKNPGLLQGCANFIEAMNKWSNTNRLLPTCTFGKKHPGHSWEMICKTDPGFANWCLGNTQDDDVRYTINHWLGK